MADMHNTASGRVISDTDESDADESQSQTSKRNANGRPTNQTASPVLFHKVKETRSILALIVSGSRIFAGTEGGEIIVWSFQNYEEITRLKAHEGAVLCLYLSSDSKRLFSCAGDAIVNVWSTVDFKRLFSIYSTFDVGDVFCAVYSTAYDTVVLGAQNTSLQWCSLSQTDVTPRLDLKSHPSQRSHRFFDSKGPGGLPTPRSEHFTSVPDDSLLLEIKKSNIIQYAHNGYVYCMLLVESSPLENTITEILITGGGDGNIKLWQISKAGEGVALSANGALNNGDDSILTLALKDTLLYAGKLDGEIDVWDLDTRQLIQTVKVAEADVLCLTVGFGYVFTGTANGHAKIFERHRRKAEWKAHDHLILAATLTEHNDKPYLITGGNDDCVAIWDLTGFMGNQKSTARASNELLVQSLSRFVSFRTISSKENYREDCREGASWLRNLLKRFGAQTELLKTDQGYNPIVYACFKGKSSSKKRTLFYGHYDVVLAENDHGKWKSDPFTLHGRDGYLYGRGVSDNKGPVIAAAYAVADLVATQQLESDVVFLIEGEEEKGSRGFERAFQTHKELIGEISWILLANSYWLTDEFPCLTYGLRGVLNATLTIESGSVDLHSGVSGSNAVNEPLKDLIQLISIITDKNNFISIPGFYEKIQGFTKQEEHWYNAISQRLPKTQAGFSDPETLKSKWREPSFTVHGFKTSSSGVSTVIPHRAVADVSFRLVPNQEAREISSAFNMFVQSQFSKMSSSNKLDIKLDHPVDPWLGDPNNGIYQALEEAIIDVWKLGKSSAKSSNVSDLKSTATSLQRPLYIREGGSIPAIRFLEKSLNAPAAQLPCGQASDNAHLENERLRLTNLYNAREIFKKVFRQLPTK